MSPISRKASTVVALTLFASTISASGALIHDTQADYDERTTKAAAAILAPLGEARSDARFAHDVAMDFLLIGPCRRPVPRNQIDFSFMLLDPTQQRGRIAYALIGLLLQDNLGRAPHTFACTFAERAKRERFLLR